MNVSPLRSVLALLFIAATLSSCSDSSGATATPDLRNTDCEAAFNFEGRTYVNVANQGVEQVRLGKAIGFGYSEPCYDSDGTKYMNEHRFYRLPGAPIKEAILFKDGGKGDVLVNTERAGKNREVVEYLDDVHTYE